MTIEKIMDIRERIVEECSHLLMTTGPSFTMDAVARQCGISKRTLYETFPDKRTLIGECMRRDYEVKNAEVKEIFETSPNCFVAMFKVYTRVLGVFSSHSMVSMKEIKRLYPDLFAHHLESEKNLVKGLTCVLHQAQEQGLVIERVNPEIAAFLFIKSMNELHDRKSVAEYGFSEATVFEQLFISFLRGIATIKGIELLSELEKQQQVK